MSLGSTPLDLPIIASEKHWDNVFTNVFFLICLLAIDGFLLYSAFNDIYVQVDRLALGIALLIGAPLLIRSILKQKYLLLFHDRIEARSLFNFFFHTYYFGSLEWAERVYTHKNVVYYELIVVSPNHKFRISTQSDADCYGAFREAVAKATVPDENILDSRKRKNVIASAITMGLIGVLLLFSCYRNSNSTGKPSSSDSLVTISGTMLNKAEVSGGGKSAKSISITLAAYPKFNFDISGDTYSLTYARSYVESVFKGDTIQLSIAKDQYEKKLLHTRPLGFWDKGYGYRVIDVYGLRKGPKVFLDPSDYFKANSQPGVIPIFVMILGITLVMGCLVMFMMIARGDIDTLVRE